LGQCRLRANKPDEAAKLFQEAEALGGYVLEIRRNWGEALFNSGQRDKARSLLLASIDHTPKVWQLYWDYAAMVETREHHTELLERWQQRLMSPQPVSHAIERAVAKSATLADDFELAYSIYRRLVAYEIRKVSEAWNAKPNSLIPKIIKPKKNELSDGKGETCLKDFKSALDHEDVPFFLMAGTVLGYVRDGALLPGDKDVDIGIFEKDYDRSRIENILKASGNFQIKRVDNNADRIRAVHQNGVWLDVFPYFKEGKRTWHAGTVARWWHEHFDLTDFEVDGVEFKIPANTEDYLEWNYGPDWRIPYGLFDVYEDAPNAEVLRPDFLKYSTWRKTFEALNVRDWAKVLKYVSKDPEIIAENPWMRHLQVMATKQNSLQEEVNRVLLAEQGE
jgi:tetratricopeptide (TPR) repeat protein